MKLSTSIVLLSISSASAFPANYANKLSGYNELTLTKPIPAAVDYLDEVPSLVSALEEAAVAATAPAATAPSAADYMTALNETPNGSSPSGAGLTSYLDTVASPGVARVGAGITSYLDTVSQTAPAAPATPAAASAPVAPAAPEPVTHAAQSTVTTAGPGITNYLDSVQTITRSTGGAGLTSYLDTANTKARATGGVGLTSYLDTANTKARATGGAGITSYSNALPVTNAQSSGNSAATGAPGSTLAFLDNVHKTVMSLPDDGNRKIIGDTVLYTRAEGPYAMSFIKR